LLHAFGKKSQQTPRKEIGTAEARLQEYRSRH
jgi:ribosome-binding protein aMBF1 (putative translation factor)